jgi:hypothetical protein
VEPEEKGYPLLFTDYVLSGEIIGELNCLINEPMKYSATCKTVVEVRKHHLYPTIVCHSMSGIKCKGFSVLNIHLQSSDNLLFLKNYKIKGQTLL